MNSIKEPLASGGFVVLDSKTMTFFATLCLFALVSQCYAQENAEIVISEGGLNYAAWVALDILSKDLPSKPIQDVLGNPSLSNIRITEFVMPVAVVQLNEGVGIKLSLNDISIKAEANWRWEKKVLFTKMKDSGSVSASTRVSISLSVRVGSESGKPTITAYSCSTSLRDLKVKVSGSKASLLYNLLISLFKKMVRSTLDKKICDAALSVINDKGAQQLSTLILEAKVNEFLTIDYSLSKAPYIGSSFLKSYHRGIFVGDSKVEPTLSMSTPTNKMIGISLSENVFNSATRVLYNAGAIKYSFNFNDWNKLTQDLPFLPKEASGPFEVNIYANKVPTTLISMSGISINISADVDVVSKPAGQDPKIMLKGKLYLAANVTALISSSALKGSVLGLRVEIVDVNPPLPDMQVSVINASLRGLVTLALPFVNAELDKGVPLPTVNGVSFPEASLVLGSRYLSVSTNVFYQG